RGAEAARAARPLGLSPRRRLGGAVSGRAGFARASVGNDRSKRMKATVSRYRWTILGAGVVAQASFSALLIGLASIAPAIQHRYDLGLAQVGIVLAAVNIGTVLTLLPWGLLADLVGERTTIALGL